VLSGYAGSCVDAWRDCGPAGCVPLRSLWLSLPPSVHLSIPPRPTLRGTLCPPTVPVQLQLPAGAERYLRPSQAFA